MSAKKVKPRAPLRKVMNIRPGLNYDLADLRCGHQEIFGPRAAKLGDLAECFECGERGKR